MAPRAARPPHSGQSGVTSGSQSSFGAGSRRTSVHLWPHFHYWYEMGGLKALRNGVCPSGLYLQNGCLNHLNPLGVMVHLNLRVDGLGGTQPLPTADIEKQKRDPCRGGQVRGSSGSLCQCRCAHGLLGLGLEGSGVGFLLRRPIKGRTRRGRRGPPIHCDQ